MSFLFRQLIFLVAFASCLGGTALGQQTKDRAQTAKAAILALKEIELTEDQQDAFKAVFAEMREERMGRRERQQGLRRAMRDILSVKQRWAFRKAYSRILKDSEESDSVAHANLNEEARDAFAQAAEYSAGKGGISLLVAKDGETLYEYYANGGYAKRAHELASGTKSFAGVIAVAAMEDGWLDLDEAVSGTIEEWQEDKRLSKVTVRQLLTLCSGIDAGKSGRPPSYADAIMYAAKHQPGEQYAYGPVPFQVFGELIQRKLNAQGRDIDALAYLDERIFQPCGVSYVRWRRDKDGNPHLPSGAALTARDWAKFGQMIAGYGMVGETRVLEEASVDLLFQSTEANSVYGLCWWLYRDPEGKAQQIGLVRRNIDANSLEGVPEDLAMAAGAGKQRLFISRSENLVIVRQAEGISASLMGRDSGYKDAELLDPILRAVSFGFDSEAALEDEGPEGNERSQEG